jgi:hypothetical protein
VPVSVLLVFRSSRDEGFLSNAGSMGFYSALRNTSPYYGSSEISSRVRMECILWSASNLKAGQVSSIPEHVLRDDFYGRHVVLEREPDLSYIASTLHIGSHHLELAFNVPGFSELATGLGFGDTTLQTRFVDELWRYRVCKLDVRAIRSGLESRLYGAVRLSFPKCRAQAAVLKVFAISLYIQYSSALLLSLLRKHARKFPFAYNHIFDLVKQSILIGGPLGTMRLVKRVCALEDTE